MEVINLTLVNLQLEQLEDIKKIEIYINNILKAYK